VLPGRTRSTRAVQVLSRSPLTPKQQLMLVQVVVA
jgi:flagellar biogenesis protein FliO